MIWRKCAAIEYVAPAVDRPEGELFCSHLDKDKTVHLVVARCEERASTLYSSQIGRFSASAGDEVLHTFLWCGPLVDVIVSRECRRYSIFHKQRLELRANTHIRAVRCAR